MKKLVLMTLAACLVSSGAHAETPSEIITPYSAYKQSLEMGNYEDAAKQAYQAWKTAEKLLGDHPQTGILAQNYANLNAHAQLDHFQIVSAYMRSVDLAETSKAQTEALDLLVQYTNNMENDRLKRKLIRKIRNRYIPRSMDPGVYRNRYNRP